MIFRLDGGVEIVSIVQAVLHVAVVLQEDTRQHIAQSSLAINHLQGCRGGGSAGVSHSRLARRLRSLHCDCVCVLHSPGESRFKNFHQDWEAAPLPPTPVSPS